MANSVIANAAMHAASRAHSVESSALFATMPANPIQRDILGCDRAGQAKPFGGSRREIRELLCCRGRSLSFFDRSRIVEIHSPES